MYQVIVIHTRRRGRPKFHISKDQLALLRNLSFSWTRNAGMLGVSRMTIYRRRRVYNLLVEGDAVPDDVELDAILRPIRLTLVKLSFRDISDPWDTGLPENDYVRWLEPKTPLTMLFECQVE